jgi:hypothetical protein
MKPSTARTTISFTAMIAINTRTHFTAVAYVALDGLRIYPVVSAVVLLIDVF